MKQFLLTCFAVVSLLLLNGCASTSSHITEPVQFANGAQVQMATLKYRDYEHAVTQTVMQVVDEKGEVGYRPGGITNDSLLKANTTAILVTGASVFNTIERSDAARDVARTHADGWERAAAARRPDAVNISQGGANLSSTSHGSQAESSSYTEGSKSSSYTEGSKSSSYTGGSKSSSYTEGSQASSYTEGNKTDVSTDHAIKFLNSTSNHNYSKTDIDVSIEQGYQGW